MCAASGRNGTPRWLLWLSITAASACAPKGVVMSGAPPDGIDVVVVPGCPTETNGELSMCLWRRAVWAAHLYQSGVARNLLMSGGAAYTPYYEADALALGVEALGVPPEHVFRETQALHTDQNTGYSLAVVRQLGFTTVGMASDAGHSDGMCSMAARWGWECSNLPMDYAVVDARIREGLPEVRATPIPEDRWIAEHREPRMATSAHYSSFGYYAGVILKATFTGSRPPKPPHPEPSLSSGRVGIAP